MSLKHVLLSVIMAVILAAAIANELNPRAWKVAVVGPSMVSNDPDRANWEPHEVAHVTLEEDRMEGKLADNYESRGPSSLVDYIGLNHNDAPIPAPTPASLAETAEGYNKEGGMSSNSNGCRCKHEPPTPAPSVAETADGYKQKGGMSSNHNGCRCKHKPPTPAPSVAETAEGYKPEGEMTCNHNGCRCKHEPPTGERPAEAPAKFQI